MGTLCAVLTGCELPALAGSGAAAAPGAQPTAPAAAPAAAPAVPPPAPAAAPAPAAPAAAVPAALPTAPSRGLDVEDTCAAVLLQVVPAFDALTDTITSGGAVHNGHSLGVHVVELQRLAATTADPALAALIGPVTADVAAIREHLLAIGDDLDALDAAPADALSAHSDDVTAYCSEQLDPLA